MVWPEDKIKQSLIFTDSQRESSQLQVDFILNIFIYVQLLYEAFKSLSNKQKHFKLKDHLVGLCQILDIRE